jgi:hypothetical protein
MAVPIPLGEAFLSAALGRLAQSPNGYTIATVAFLAPRHEPALAAALAALGDARRFFKAMVAYLAHDDLLVVAASLALLARSHRDLGLS